MKSETRTRSRGGSCCQARASLMDLAESPVILGGGANVVRAACAWLGFAEQRGERDVERLGERLEFAERDVLLAGFEARQIARVVAFDGVGEFGQGERLRFAVASDGFADVFGVIHEGYRGPVMHVAQSVWRKSC